jgi:hypothetical protein
MGNSIGANISVQLNQDQAIYGGSKLTGTIYLNVDKEYISADSLNVKFYGREVCQVEIRDGENGVIGETAQSELICLDFVLHRFNGRALKGRFEFPFEFVLPAGLPGKQGVRGRKLMSWGAYDGNWLLVEYFLEARLHRNGFMVSDIKNSREILLSDPPYYSTKIPSFMEPISLPVFFCKCYKTGTMTLLANVDTINVFVNEMLQIEFAVRNDSTSKVQAVEVTVKAIHQFAVPLRGYDLTMQFMGGSRTHATYNTTSNVLFQRIASTGAPNEFRMPDSNVDSLSKLLKVTSGNIPNIRPSYNGHFGSVRYVVDVKVITAIGTKDLEICIPITVLRNRADFRGINPAVEIPIALPLDWVAEIAPCVKLAYQSPPLVQPSAPNMQNSVSALIQTLQQSTQWTEIKALKDWISHGNVNEFTHETLGYVFQTIHGEYSYTAFPEIIGEAMFGILNCYHISGAAMGVPNMHRAAVCYNFARYCIDKQNASVEFQRMGLPPYAVSLLLISYKG